jgi:hypothetical protein
MSTHTEPVIHEISDPSSSTSSSSDSDDDKPLDQRYPKLLKRHPTSTKTYKKLSQSIPFEPMFSTIHRKISELLEPKSSKLPHNHPNQPQYIPPLNMILPDNVDIESDLQKASEVASMEVASESPHHHQPQNQQFDPQITTDPIASPEHVSTSEHVSVPETAVLEHIVPEQPVPEPTQSSTIPLHVQVVKITRFDGVSITTDMDIDSEDDQDDPQSSNMVINTVPDQPSTSNPETTNGQSSSNLAIVPTVSPKPSRKPSLPTRFLDSHVLQGVCVCVCVCV